MASRSPLRGPRARKRPGATSHFLVTGGAGFIGSHLVGELVRRGKIVTVLDDLSSGHMGYLRPLLGGIRFIRGDVRGGAMVRRASRGCDHIVHLAAIASVRLSLEQPKLCESVNIGGTINVLQAASDQGLKNVVYASSAAVYGDEPGLPKREDMAARPSSPYGLSKIISEYYCSEFHHSSGLSSVALRFFNVYGPRQACSDYSGVITRFIAQARQGRPVCVFGTGEQTRDFIHVSDVVTAILIACNRRARGFDLFNIGTGRETAINRIAAIISRHYQVGIVHSRPHPGDIGRSVCSTARAKGKLRFRAALDFTHGLGRLLRDPGAGHCPQDHDPA
jgi:nucleoside-diphosphate-sugar epimerase